MFQPDQYAAVRRRAGILDRSARGRIAIRGADRTTFLHALLTNDIAGLAPGSGCYAALLNPQGRLVADMYVLDIGDVTLLDVHSDVTNDLLARFDMLIFSEDVQLGDVTSAWGCLSVQGPNAPGMLGRALAGTDGGSSLEADLHGLAELATRRFAFAGDTAVVARSDEFGGPGFWVYLPFVQLGVLRVALEAAGVVVVDADTAETLRIETGRPAFGVDLDQEIIPLEAGLETRAISWTKGCYPGQEVIVRIRDRGHGRIARKLVGLRVDETEIPARGERLEVEGRDIGRITSAAWSPALECPIALGYVHRDFTEPGARVQIVHGDVRPAATVTALPFVGPGRGASAEL